MILRPHPFSHAALPLRHRCFANTKSQSSTSAISHSQRTFTTSQTFFQEARSTHYDVLGVSPSVSHAELKKRFYVLSKENHPDLHPGSKEHTTKFQEISESYTVLADPDKRRKYDRDVMGSRPSVQKGSGFAGSRPATGLSKRRSAFRGPPPSYYGKRGEPSSSQSQSESTSSSSSAYAWGPEPQFSQTHDFNPQPVYRTQSAEDERRSRRNAAAAQAAQTAFDDEGEFWSRFVMVTVILTVGVTLGTMVVGAMNPRPTGGGMVRGDGSLRRQEDGGKKKDLG